MRSRTSRNEERKESRKRRWKRVEVSFRNHCLKRRPIEVKEKTIYFESHHSEGIRVLAEHLLHCLSWTRLRLLLDHSRQLHR